MALDCCSQPGINNTTLGGIRRSGREGIVPVEHLHCLSRFR